MSETRVPCKCICLDKPCDSLTGIYERHRVGEGDPAQVSARWLSTSDESTAVRIKFPFAAWDQLNTNPALLLDTYPQPNLALSSTSAGRCVAIIEHETWITSHGDSVDLLVNHPKHELEWLMAFDDLIIEMNTNGV